MPGIIYKAVNKINGKIYIGQTTRSLAQRKREHKYDASKNLYNMPFHNAIRKYGFENFSWLVVKTVENIDSLDGEEIKIIGKLKSATKSVGYNVSKGGKVLRGKDNPFYGKKHTDETKRKISCSSKGVSRNKGRVVSLETRKKLSRYAKQRYQGKGNPMYGRKHSEETKRLLSIRAKMRPIDTRCFNHLIRDWLIIYPSGKKEIISNLKKFCRENNLSQGNMFNVALRKVNHCKGYKCRKLLKEYIYFSHSYIN